ncbi:hypothetical protein [Rhodococcus pyridinivorans]
MALLVVTAVIGTVHLFSGAIQIPDVTVNLIQVVLGLLLLSVVIQSARCRGPENEGER